MTNGGILQDLARQVRGDTIRILEAADDAWLTYTPPGTSNHILWHAGHALWLQDLLCERLLSAGGALPLGWAETFGMNCKPPSETKDWPSREELRSHLQAQLGRVLELLAATSDNRLAEIADANRGPATIASRIIHGLHDEAKHCGEMYLILKLCRVQGSSRR